MANNTVYVANVAPDSISKLIFKCEDENRWFFFDRNGVPHFYDSEQQCSSFAILDPFCTGKET